MCRQEPGDGWNSTRLALLSTRPAKREHISSVTERTCSVRIVPLLLLFFSFLHCHLARPFPIYILAGFFLYICAGRDVGVVYQYVYCTYRHEYNEECRLQAKHPETLQFRLQSVAGITRLQQYFSTSMLVSHHS
jgi:hypothetical protein